MHNSIAPLVPFNEDIQCSLYSRYRWLRMRCTYPTHYARVTEVHGMFLLLLLLLVCTSSALEERITGMLA